MSRTCLFKGIVFIVLFFILDVLIGQFLRLGNNKYFMEKSMSEFYRQRQNIDLLFMGSSHSYYHFNPFFFEKQLDVTAFNLGSSGQNPTSTYFLLQEAFNHGHKPKVIVLETAWRPLTGNDTDFYSASRVFHAMRWSANKIGLFWHSFSFPSSLRLFSHTFRYRRNFSHFFLPSENTRKEKYRLNLTYIGKGFVTSPNKITSENLIDHEFKDQKIEFNQYRISYLKKTIRLALENHTCVLGVISPLPPTVFADIPNYRYIHQTIASIYESYGIKLLDLNIINQHTPIVEDIDFIDSHHLNSNGASKLDSYLAEYLQKTILSQCK